MNELLPEEKEFKDVIDSLKSLQKIEAPSNFEADLMRKINQQNFPAEKRKFWDIVFSRLVLIPSAGVLTAAVVLIFILTNKHKEEFQVAFNDGFSSEYVVYIPSKKVSISKDSFTRSESQSHQESNSILQNKESFESPKALIPNAEEYKTAIPNSLGTSGDKVKKSVETLKEEKDTVKPK